MRHADPVLGLARARVCASSGDKPKFSGPNATSSLEDRGHKQLLVGILKYHADLGTNLLQCFVS